MQDFFFRLWDLFFLFECLEKLFVYFGELVFLFPSEKNKCLDGHTKK